MIINGVAVFYIAGTGVYTPATPERTTRNEISGTITNVQHAADLSGAFGKLKFEVVNSKANIDLYKSIANSYEENTVAAIGNERDGTADFDGTLERAVLANQADIDFSPDGSIEFMFHGNDVTA